IGGSTTSFDTQEVGVSGVGGFVAGLIAKKYRIIDRINTCTRVLSTEQVAITIESQAASKGHPVATVVLVFERATVITKTISILAHFEAEVKVAISAFE